MIRFFIFTLLFFCSFYTSFAQTDTIIIDGVEVIRDAEYEIPKEPKKSFFKKLNARTNLKKWETQYLLVDIGFSNYNDRTDYTNVEAQEFAPNANPSWMKLRTLKSTNINLWLVGQRVSIVNNIANIKYKLGVEFNNYRFKQPVRFQKNNTATNNEAIIYIDEMAMGSHPSITYKKNKLAAEYVTVPILLNFNLTPHRLYNLGISAGISAGYLLASRNKFINSDIGKKKIKDDFELDPWKIAYVGELELGVVTLYGSYAPKSMFKRGLEIMPYNVGFRINPAGIFNKINFEK